MLRKNRDSLGAISSRGGTTLLVVMLMVYPLPLSPATITVDDSTSTVATDGRCSLREAINNANSDADSTGGDCTAGDVGRDTIELATDVSLTAVDNEFGGANGLPLITTDVIVDGNDHVVERDPSAPDFRLFYFVVDRDHPFAESALREVTINNGTEGVSVGGDNHYHVLRITDSVVSGSTGRGVSGWRVILDNSMISGNGDAGVRGFDVVVDTSVISDNSGWGIDALAGLVVSNSTVSGNQRGGIIAGQPDLEVTITNTTISGNSRYGVWVGSYRYSATITQSTITGNFGDGLVAYSWNQGSSPPVEIAGSIVADNLGENCDSYTGNFPWPSAFIDQGFNFSDDDSCPAGFEATTGLDPKLADNGGPTKTHALLPGSSAIDAGGDVCPDTDQRGVYRPQDGNDDGVATCDAGAYEYQYRAPALEIDIKPHSDPNSINPRSRGVIPVAILGSETLDVAGIDEGTLRFGPGAASIAHLRGHLEDLNYDGLLDLVTHYRTQDTGIACGDESATLIGETLDGKPIEGTDSIQTVGCRETRRPAIWMKDQDRPDTMRRTGPVNIERK